MSDTQGGGPVAVGAIVVPKGRLRRMARAFNCPELFTGPQGAVATRFLASRLKGTGSRTTQEKLVALQDGLVEQEQTC